MSGIDEVKFSVTIPALYATTMDEISTMVSDQNSGFNDQLQVPMRQRSPLAYMVLQERPTQEGGGHI